MFVFILISLIVDGEWSNWKAWSTCSSTCAESYKMRIRACDNPAPAYGGLECSGSSYELQTCPFIHCPGQFLVTNILYYFFSVHRFLQRGILKNIFNLYTVNGDWSSWGAWGTCSVTCGNGAEARERKCSNPEPMYGGRPCQGHPTESRSCLPKYCSGMPSLERILQHDVILVFFIIWMYKSSNSVAHFQN